MRLRLYLGRAQAEVVQTYQTLSKVVSDSFGGSGRSSSPGPDVAVPQTAEELQTAFRSVFG